MIFHLLEVNVKKFISFNQLVVLMIFLMLVTFSFDIQKNTLVNIELGEVIEKDITAQKSVSYIDEVETTKQKELAVSQAQEAYEKKTEIKDTLLNDVKTFFNSVIEEKAEYAKENSTSTNEEGISRLVVTPKNNYLLKVENPFKLKTEEIEYFFELSESTLNSMRDVFSIEIEKIYHTGFTEAQMELTVSEFKNNSNFYFFDAKARDIFIKSVSMNLQPNMVLNEEETKKRIEEARDSISDVTKSIKRGEIVLRKGEIVEEQDIAVLSALGYSKEEFKIKETLKRIPIIFILFMMIHAFLIKFNYKESTNKRLYFLVYSLLFLTVSIDRFIQNEFITNLLIMIALFIIVTFVSPNIAIIYSLVLGMVMNLGDYQILLTSLVMGSVLRIFYDKKADRNAILNLGLVTTLALIVTHVAYNLAIVNVITVQDIYTLIVPPVFASVIVLGLFPYLEVILGTVTSLKLHELTRSNHHLVKRINDEIPGTYHHSQRVGQLAEAAADRIGANGLLIKVAAIFHDAGKLKNPKYFVENLLPGEENPHNHLTPEQSAEIIRKHPIDSVLLCKKYGLPEQIIELIEKHHGDDKVNYFYTMAINEGREVNAEDFVYQTPLPVTKEEGILMLADISEASSRAFINEEHHVAREKLTDIIYSKIEDGQLRECELTMKEINIVIDAFLQFLLPSAHTRPVYPKKIK